MQMYFQKSKIYDNFIFKYIFSWINLNLIPLWLSTRKIYFFSAVIDSLIILLCSNLLFLDFNSFNKNIFLVSFIIFWIFQSYLFGRYTSDFLKNNLISKTKLIYNLAPIFSSFIVLKFIFNSEYLFKNSSDELFFLLKLFLLGFTSFILQTFIKYIFYKIEKSNKTFLFFGSSEVTKLLKEEMHIAKFNLNIKFLEDYKIHYKSLNFENFNGVLFENEKEIKKFDLFLKSKSINTRFNKYTIDYVQNKYLQRLPSSLFDVNKFDSLKKEILDKKYQFLIKRFGDIIVCLLLLIIFSPLMLLVSIIIYLYDRKSIFYSQIRTGQNGKFFKITKFRTMNLNAEENGPIWSQKNDVRITKIGKILRKTRIDELPQLVAVLRGNMSLIGPRPERPEIEEQLIQEIDFYMKRYLVKPGISGWAQVNYVYGASIKDSKNKLSYDLFYLKNLSIFFDLLIFFKTIKVLFNFQGSEPEKSTSKKTL